MIAPATDRELPFRLRPGTVLSIVAALTVLRLFVAARTGLVHDEAYYAEWSTVPSAGYLDHPPMIAWMIAAGRVVLGESALAVRLLPVLSVTVTSLAVYRTGALLLDMRSAGVAVIWFSVTVAAGLLFIAAPDAPLVMFWALAIWAVAEFAARGNANWWLAVGLFAGLALLSKYTAAFLGVGLLLYLISSRARLGWLRLWQVWAGGLIAVLVFLPNLLWNLLHEWASIGFQGRRLDTLGTSLGSMAGNFGELLAGQLLATGIALFVFIGVAAWAFARRREVRTREGLALPILTGLPLIVFFLFYTAQFRVEANWMLPVWPMLALAGGWAVVHVRPRGAVSGWILRALRWLQVPLGIAIVGTLYAQALWQPLTPPASIDRTRDMRGWAELEREVAALAVGHGAQWVAVGDANYGLAAQLSTEGRFAGRTLPVRSVVARNRWQFLPPLPAATVEAPALYVVFGRAEAERALRHFGTAEPIGEALRRHGDDVLQRVSVFLVSQPSSGVLAMLTDG